MSILEWTGTVSQAEDLVRRDRDCDDRDDSSGSWRLYLDILLDKQWYEKSQ